MGALSRPDAVCDLDPDDFCGGLLVAGTLYTAWDGKVATFDSTGTETVLSGSLLTTTQKGFWARNNNTTTDIVFVDPDNGAYTVTSSAVSAFADVDAAGVNSVCFQHGYFFFTRGDGRVINSDLNAVTVNGLGFTTADAKPDGALRAIPWQRPTLHLRRKASIQIYGDTANAPPAFPYSLVATVSTGLAGRYAVAGHEDGFGGKGLIWVADDNTVVILKGYQPDKISPPQLDRLIEAVFDKNTLEACVYISGGHPKWVLSCDAWTWEFDLNTQKWNERASYLIPRWRGTQAVFAFDKWIMGDTMSGTSCSPSTTWPRPRTATRCSTASSPARSPSFPTAPWCRAPTSISPPAPASPPAQTRSPPSRGCGSPGRTMAGYRGATRCIANSGRRGAPSSG